MNRLALTAVGADRPGIVAAITKVLMEEGCNLEDSSMTILGGQFAILLLLEAPASTGAQDLEARLAPVREAFDLMVVVRAVTPGVESGAGRGSAGESVVFSVHGADRPGIVHTATESLARAGGNVVDLETRLVGEGPGATYVVILTAGFPPDADVEDAARRVVDAVEAIGVRCTSHRVETDEF